MIVINVAKVILVNSELSKLLLIKRSQSDDRRPGQWDLPGGWVEKAESIEQGAVRECLEEVGVNIETSSLRLIYTMSAKIDDRKQLVNWLIFTANTKETKVKLSFEHDEYSWQSMDQALAMITYERQKIPLEMVHKHKLIPELFKTKSRQ
jgi:8-oxo-dGTP diphosphatase